MGSYRDPWTERRIRCRPRVWTKDFLILLRRLQPDVVSRVGLEPSIFTEDTNGSVQLQAILKESLRKISGPLRYVLVIGRSLT